MMEAFRHDRWRDLQCWFVAIQMPGGVGLLLGCR